MHSLVLVPRKQFSDRNTLPALFQNSGLVGNIPQAPDDLFIPIYKCEDRIWDPHLLAELLDQPLGSAEVMSWNPGEKMVDSLELETTVEKVQPWGTVYVHGCAEHLLRERFLGAQVGCRHGEVR